jgi:hypothetical protein
MLVSGLKSSQKIPFRGFRVKKTKMYKIVKMEIATKALSQKGFTKYKQSDFKTL